MTSSESKILENITNKTREALEYDLWHDLKTDALNISIDLNLGRSHVSRILNNFHREGKFIKLIGRPTYFLSRSELEKKAPDAYIPSSVPLGASIQEFLISETPVEPTYQDDSYYTGVLSKNSKLYNAYRKAKAAMLYPGNKMHSLILGSPYVGKSDLIQMMENFLKQNNLITASKNMVVINCKSYLNMTDPYKFLKDLYGDYDAERKGIFDNYRNTLIVFKNVDYLDNYTFNEFRNTLLKNTYQPFGAPINFREKEIKAYLVATSETLTSDSVHTYQQIFPIQIDVPDLSERTIDEMLYLTLKSLQEESIDANQTFRVSKGVLSCIVMAQYPGNTSHLEAEIKSACASAYFRSINSTHFFIDILFEDISNSVLESITNINERIDDLNDILNLFEDEYLFFSPVQMNKELQLLIDINRTLEYTESGTISKISNELVDVCLEDINYVTSIQLNTMRAVLLKDIYNDIYPLLKESSIINNENLLYGLLLHLSTVLKQLAQGNYSHKEYEEDYLVANPNDYTIAATIKDNIYDLYKIELPQYEVDYIATYHYLSSQWVDNKYIQLLLISESGENVSNYSAYLNSLNHRAKSDYLVIDSEMHKGDIITQISDSLASIDKGKGVIIASDSSVVRELIDEITIVSSTDFVHTNSSSIQELVSLIQSLDSLDITLGSIKREEKLISTPHKPSLEDISNARELINKINSKILTESLVFLNPNKSSNVLFQVLTRITDELNISYSDQLLLKFIFHCSFLIERCIKKEPLMDSESKRLISENTEMFFVIEKHFSVVNETFSINIPNQEIGMVINIFNQHIQ